MQEAVHRRRREQEMAYMELARQLQEQLWAADPALAAGEGELGTDRYGSHAVFPR